MSIINVNEQLPKKLQILNYLSQKTQSKLPVDHLIWESSEITTPGIF